MKIGYARVSTREQNLQLQLDALHQVGCEEIFREVASGGRTDREQLQTMMTKLRKGDIVVVWKLDRIGRNLKHLVELVETFNQLGVGFQSLNNPIDTTTAHGKLTFNIFASLAEFERDIIRERTVAGLEVARKAGRIGGRPRGLSKEANKKADEAVRLFNVGYKPLEIAKMLHIGNATAYRYLKFRGVSLKSEQK